MNRTHLWPGLATALAAGQGVDQVEIKVVLAPEHHEFAITALDADPLDARIRQVYFLDTPDLRLHRQGVILRARRTQRRADDTVIKLRRSDPADHLTRSPRRPSLQVELDALPGTLAWSAALKRRWCAGAVQAAVGGNAPLRTLFSPAQRALLRRAAGKVGIDALTVLGPVTVTKLRINDVCPGARTALETWRYPDGSQVMELTTKCLPSRAVRIAAATANLLSERGIAPSELQRTKTGTSLVMFTTPVISTARWCPRSA